MLGLINDKSSQKYKDWLKKIESLTDLVGAGPHELPWSFDETASTASLELLGNPAPAFAHLAADARLTGSGEAASLDLYATGNPIVLKQAINLAVFDLKADLGGELSGSGPVGPGTVKFAASLGAELRYRHYLPVREDYRRVTAYSKVITGSRFPYLLDLGAKLSKGEAHRLDLKIIADLGLDLEAGYAFAETTALEFAAGLAPSFEFELKASIMASLGLAYSSRMILVVGEAGQRNDAWTRVRLQREKASRLSFGLTFALDLKYDLGTSLAQLFEDSLDSVPTPRLVRAAREILRYAKNPEKLAGEAAEVVEDLVDEQIIDPLTGSAGVQKAVAFAKEVVTFYDGLDGEVQGLWDRLLSKVDLDPASSQGKRVRAWLDRIAALDGSELPIEDFLEGNQADLADAIEAFSGQTFEGLLLTKGLEKTLQDAAAIALKAKDLLDKTDDRILDKIREFSKKTGIDDLAARLRKIDSVEKLQKEATLRVKRAVEKLVGKTLDQVSPGDLERVTSWATKLDRYLFYADPDDESGEFHNLTGKIKALLEEVKVEYGLSVAFELERVNRSTALLDFEIDPKTNKKLLRKVFRSLRRCDVPSMLLAMLDHQTEADEKAENKGKEPPELAFLLRECVFTSERIRTTGFSSFFTMVGLGRKLSVKQSGRTQRIERSRLELRASEDRRLATFTSGLVRSDVTAEMAANAAAWLMVEEEGPLDPRDPFDGARSATLRLAFATEDTTTGETELAALEHLLFHLGFETSGKRLPADVITTGAASRFACEIRLPVLTADRDLLEQIASLATGGNQLDSAFLDATLRWLKERFVTNPTMLSGRSIGEIVAHGVKRSWFVIHGKSSGALSGMPNPPKSLSVDGRVIGMSLNPAKPDPVGSKFIGLAVHREKLSKQISGIGTAWARARDRRTEQDYHSFSETLSDLMRGFWLRGSWWPNPMFGIWFWIAMINKLVPESLASARGFASFRGLRIDQLASATETWATETYLLNRLPDNQGGIFMMDY